MPCSLLRPVCVRLTTYLAVRHVKDLVRDTDYLRLCSTVGAYGQECSSVAALETLAVIFQTPINSLVDSAVRHSFGAKA